jgi:hypothetical protein
MSKVDDFFLAWMIDTAAFASDSPIRVVDLSAQGKRNASVAN